MTILSVRSHGRLHFCGHGVSRLCRILQILHKREPNRQIKALVTDRIFFSAQQRVLTVVRRRWPF